MNHILRLTLKSIWSRKSTTVLTILSVCVATVLLLSIEKIKTAARKSFEGTLSQVDLIVGSKTSPLHVLLYSVFRIGDPTNNIRYTTYENLKNHPEVKFVVPISLGDSHKGYRVIGTNTDYFQHYKYRGGQSLSFEQGQIFQNLFEVVVGSEVAQKLKYKIGDKITLSHGSDAVAFQEHTDTPFTIVGILKPTQTPVDQSLHVSLEAIEAIHIGWDNGAPSKQPVTIPEQIQIHQVTALFIGLNSRTSVFKLKREIDENESEPLIAVLPGVVFTDLWKNLSFVENVLKVLSSIVFVSSLITLLLVLLSSLNERRREMAILRSLGAPAKFIFGLLFMESFVLTLTGLILGFGLQFISILVIGPFLESQFGLQLYFEALTPNELTLMGSMLSVAIFVGLFPSLKAYKTSVSDGLTPKVS